MDKKDFDNIFILLKDKVFRFARFLMQDETEAEDVTQDIFEKLWLNQDKIPNFNNIESYVIRSTKNLCLDRIKHRNVVLKSSKDLKYTNNNLIEPDNDKKEMSNLIKEVIKELPKTQQMIIHLRDIEGYEFEEISKITGVEVNTIRVNLSRARKRVKEELLKTMNYGLQ
jgi:RNA polymerase sigma-70 factor (ECF subfamily)